MATLYKKGADPNAEWRAVYISKAGVGKFDVEVFSGKGMNRATVGNVTKDLKLSEAKGRKEKIIKRWESEGFEISNSFAG
jgi:hypothetical protein